MAEIKIAFQCGCGFTTSSPVEASKHCDSKKHSLTIGGEVKKPQVKKVSTAYPER